MSKENLLYREYLKEYVSIKWDKDKWVQRWIENKRGNKKKDKLEGK